MTIVDKEKKDRFRTTGTVLVIAGVAVWIVYVIVRYGMGYDVTGRQFLPYHLAGVVPGAVLRRHQFFGGLVRRIFSKEPS
jgi:hypothetical protein